MGSLGKSLGCLDVKLTILVQYIFSTMPSAVSQRHACAHGFRDNSKKF